MKKLLFLGALALLPILAQAQYSNFPAVIGFAGAPSGSCAATQLAVNTSSGALSSCNGGTWTAVGTVFTGGTITTPILAADGSSAAPSYSFTNSPGSGMYVASNSLVIQGNNGALAWFTMVPTANYQIRSDGIFGWSSTTTALGNNSDLAIRRLAAASLVQGLANSASPIAQTFTLGESSRGGTDSNVAGANGTFSPGIGTGIALPSKLIFKTPAFGGTGTTAQTSLVRDVLGHTSASLITNNTATLIVRTAANANTTIGVLIHYCVEVKDGTNTQSETGIATFSGSVNSGATQTLAAVVKSANAQAVTSGTLAVTWTIVTNGSSADIKVTSNSSLTPTTNKVTIEVINLSGDNDVTLF